MVSLRRHLFCQKHSILQWAFKTRNNCSNGSAVKQQEARQCQHFWLILQVVLCILSNRMFDQCSSPLIITWELHLTSMTRKCCFLRQILTYLLKTVWRMFELLLKSFHYYVMKPDDSIILSANLHRKWKEQTEIWFLHLVSKNTSRV